MAGRGRDADPAGAGCAAGVVGDRLAELAGVSRVTVGSIERLDHLAVVTAYVRLARTLGISLDGLLAGAPRAGPRLAMSRPRSCGRWASGYGLLRLLRELTQGDPAEAAGISRTFVSLIEKALTGSTLPG